VALREADVRFPSRIALLASVLAALFLGACGGAPARPAEVPTWERPGLAGAVRPEMGSPQPGERAPDFELPGLDGAATRLSSLRGSWVLLHFTASWCPYCDSEIAHLGELADAYAPRGLRVVVVDVKEDAAVWTPYARAHVARSIIALNDGSGEASKRFAPPRAQPSFTDRAQVALDSTLIIDPSGTIRLFLMPDSAHFDPTFAGVRRELDRVLANDSRVGAAAEESLPPERVVDIATASGDGEVLVTLGVRAGYHIMSNEPSEPSYVATRIRFDADDDVELGPAVFPPASQLALDQRSIAVFSGAVRVTVPYRLRAGRPATARALHGTVSYQACTTGRCLFPVTRPITVSLSAS
jgi:peroxiredoxin